MVSGVESTACHLHPADAERCNLGIEEQRLNMFCCRASALARRITR